MYGLIMMQKLKPKLFYQCIPQFNLTSPMPNSKKIIKVIYYTTKTVSKCSLFLLIYLNLLQVVQLSMTQNTSIRYYLKSKFKFMSSKQSILVSLYCVLPNEKLVYSNRLGTCATLMNHELKLLILAK